MPADYLTILKFAERYRRSQYTVRRWCQRGQLPGAYKLGHLWLIPLTATPPRLATGAAAHKRKETKP